jgi:arsenite-transporting ATPase
LPYQIDWYLEKIFPIQRRAAKAVRPFARRGTRSLLPLPEDSLFGALEKFYRAVVGVEDVLTDAENASVRIVVNAEKMIIAEARRAYTYLNLYDFAVDTVVVNKLLPEAISDRYFEGWRGAQKRHLKTIEDSFSPIPIRKAWLFEREMYGLEALEALSGEVFGDEDPLKVFFRGQRARSGEKTAGTR